MISPVFLVGGSGGNIRKLSQQKILVNYLKSKGISFKVTENAMNRHNKALDYTRVTIYLSPLEVKKLLLKEDRPIGRLYKRLIAKDQVVRRESGLMLRFLKRFKNPDFKFLPLEDFLLSAIGLPEKLPLGVYFDQQGDARDIEWALVREIGNSFMPADKKNCRGLARGDDFLIDRSVRMSHKDSDLFPWQVRIIKKMGKRIVLVGLSMGKGDEAYLTGSIFEKTGESDLPIQLQTYTQNETSLAYLMNYSPRIKGVVGSDQKSTIITSDKVRLKIAAMARAALKSDDKDAKDKITALPPTPAEAEGGLCEIDQRRILVYQLARVLLEYVLL